MYMPVRVTSLTDPILAAAGCLVGVLAQQHAAAFYRLAASRTIHVPHTAPIPEAATPDLGPTDTLVAGLMDPEAGAPTESIPAPPSKAEH